MSENRLIKKRKVVKEKTIINKKKLLIAVLIPILELTLGSLIIPHIPSEWGKIIVNDLIFFIGFIIALNLYKEVLKEDWKKFKTHLFRNFIFAILAVFISYFLLSLVRAALKSFLSAGISSHFDVLSFSTATASLGLVASLTALMAPFTEELIFRHALFYQWKNRGIVTLLMFLVSSILFGLVHWNNFKGDISQMIPYMVVGAWFAVIYYKSKNIWQNIATHFLFDFIQVLGAILILIISFIQ